MFGFEDGLGLQGKEFKNLVTFFYVRPTVLRSTFLASDIYSAFH